MRVIESALDVIEDLAGAPSLEALTERFDPFLRSYGLTAFSAGVMARGGLSAEPIHITTWPADWAAHWAENGYWTADPTVTFTLNNSRPFTWSEVTPLSGPSGRRVMQEATAFGLRGGITVPVHGGTGRIGNVSAGGEADSWSADALAAFRLAATYFHGRFCELAGLEEPLAVPRLSPREKECLSWLAAGKSAWDISVILGIGEHTVRDYVRSAMRKLGCVTQTQAVCEALRRGEIVL